MQTSPNFVAMEEEYLQFQRSGSHVRKIYSLNGSVWFQPVGSDDEPRIAILAAAHRGMMTSMNKMKSEAEYAALFDDLKKHESRWFDIILKNKYNFNLCDGLCVCLGTYASLKRNRYELDEALAILTLAKRVLDIYEAIVLVPGMAHACVCNPDMLFFNLVELRYKQNMIWLHLILQLVEAGKLDESHYDRATRYFRNLIMHEIIYGKVKDGSSIFADSLLLIRKKRTLTAADLDDTTDKELFDILCMAGDYSGEGPTRHLDTTLSKQAALKSCAQCHKQEPTRGAFQCCALCRIAHYCSRDCQTAAWKAGHKRECKGKREAK